MPCFMFRKYISKSWLEVKNWKNMCFIFRFSSIFTKRYIFWHVGSAQGNGDGHVGDDRVIWSMLALLHMLRYLYLYVVMIFCSSFLGRGCSIEDETYEWPLGCDWNFWPLKQWSQRKGTAKKNRLVSWGFQNVCGTEFLGFQDSNAELKIQGLNKWSCL